MKIFLRGSPQYVQYASLAVPIGSSIVSPRIPPRQTSNVEWDIITCVRSESAKLNHYRLSQTTQKGSQDPMVIKQGRVT